LYVTQEMKSPAKPPNYYASLNTQWAKSLKKQSARVYFWQHGTLFLVPNNKNALLQTVFWRFCPLGEMFE